MSKMAIFLGAGASKAEGAPLQGDLFAKYFSSENFKASKELMDEELTNFFLSMFGIAFTARSRVAASCHFVAVGHHC